MKILLQWKKNLLRSKNNSCYEKLLDAMKKIKMQWILPCYENLLAMKRYRAYWRITRGWDGRLWNSVRNRETNSNKSTEERFWFGDFEDHFEQNRLDLKIHFEQQWRQYSAQNHYTNVIEKTSNKKRKLNRSQESLPDISLSLETKTCNNNTIVLTSDDERSIIILKSENEGSFFDPHLCCKLTYFPKVINIIRCRIILIIWTLSLFEKKIYLFFFVLIGYSLLSRRE